MTMTAQNERGMQTGEDDKDHVSAHTELNPRIGGRYE